MGDPVPVPTLAVVGADDGCISPSVSDGQAERFTGEYRREVIPGAGHWPHRGGARRCDGVDPRLAPCVSTAGYSGTPLPRKLGIAEGAKVALIGAPEGFEELLSPLPDRVRLVRRVGRDADVIVAFFTERALLEARFDNLRAGMHDAGGLWIAWPEAGVRRPHRRHGGRRARDRPREGPRRQQGLRDRRDVVGAKGGGADG